MSDFATGFATGFANKLTERIDTRAADARDYFNKQVEVARTVGLENRRRVRATVDESVNIAKRLQEMGVPKDIIMAQANMDPAGLGDFYNQVEKLRLEADVPVNEEFFRSVYKLSGTFKAPNEDFNTFFSRMYEPIVEAAKSDPEGFKQDTEGSIFATAFGFNAMDKARAKLATTEVAPGLTAEQAIAMGDQITPNRQGESFVTVDPTVLKGATGKGSLQPPVMKQLSTEFESILGEERAGLASEFGVNDGEPNPELEAAAKKAAYDRMVELYVGDETYLSYIRTRFKLDEEGNPIDMGPTAPPEAVETPVETPETPAPTVGSQEPVEAPVTPPDASVAPLTDFEIQALEAIGGSNYVDNGDGTVTFIGPDGQQYTSTIQDLRDYIFDPNR